MPPLGPTDPGGGSLTPLRRLSVAVGVLAAVVVVGVAGYMALGLSALDALYQVVIIVSSVGLPESQSFGAAERVFTILVILVGVGAVVFAFGQIVELIVEGHLRNDVGRRRMERRIDRLNGHVVLCGWGRVGRSFSERLGGRPVVVVDRDAHLLAECPHPVVVGDATDDEVLRAAGVERAGAVISALSSDSDNLFVVVSARALQPALFIVSRARDHGATQKLRRAGADRVVNPTDLGGARMAALVAQPHVAEFVDVVVQQDGLEFRLGEVMVESGSPVAGTTLGGARLRARTGALVLAVRHPDGRFTTNPEAGQLIEANQVLIAIGTEEQLDALVRVAGS